MAITTLSSCEFMGKSFGAQTLGDLLATPGAEDIEFEPSRWRGSLSKSLDLD